MIGSHPPSATCSTCRPTVINTEIVDCHHHLWDLRNSYPWLQESAGRLQIHGDDTAIRHDYLLSDYLHDADGLSLRKSVHVDAGAADPLAESEWLQQIADQQGFPHAIISAAKLAEAGIAEHLDHIGELPNVRGVRDILNWHADPRLTYINRHDLMTDPHWLAGFGMLAPRGLSFDLQIYPGQLSDAVRLAAQHPDTLIILNHAGMPVERDPEAMRAWRNGLRALAAHDNVRIKISGIGMTDHHWTVASLRPIVLDCIDAFGPNRSMFGSNFPVDRLYSSMRDLYAAFDAITAELTDTERHQLFGGTAAAAYRI